MSRKLYRVPMDFKWPLHQVWKGYLNPYRSFNCKACDGTGQNPQTKALEEIWYSIEDAEYVEMPNGRNWNRKAWVYNLDKEDVQALVDANRLKDLTSVFTPGKGWVKKDPPYIPTPEEVNAWAKEGFGHDATNRWVCVEAKAKRLGFYGHCEFCKGEGEVFQSEEIKKLHDEWKDIEPPTGEGFQLWENCSEGSPVSPVFETLEQLCSWCEYGATTFGSAKTSKDQWMKMLQEDNVHHQEGNMVFL